MQSLIAAITNTPVWVWLLAIYLIYRGAQGLKTQVVKSRKLFTLPILFLVLSLETLVNTFQPTGINVTVWAVGLVLGVGVGYVISRTRFTKIDKDHGLVLVQGSPFTLIIILAKFIGKYYLSYRLATDPAVVQQVSFAISSLFISSFFSGLLVGRMVSYLLAFQTGPFGNLQEG